MEFFGQPLKEKMLPMLHFKLKVHNHFNLLSDIGGIWTSANAMSFVLLVIHMYNKMLRKEANVIIERQRSIGQETMSVRAVVRLLKQRLSYVSMYFLHESHLIEATRIQQLEQQVQLLTDVVR